MIGRGSYGEVWLARNAIGTMRAVKVVHRQSFQHADHFEREFKGLLKFEPISRSHDGLVDVLQIGRRDNADYFYYVMELADDASGEKEKSGEGEREKLPSAPSAPFSPASYVPRTLRSELQARAPLPPSEGIALALKLAAALEHLHANGLVHRDIKPSNIIFVAGEPKLADIGLVTAIDEAHSLVGTVGYIPPEGPGTPQADLYSLGKVLYEIAFGKDRQEFPQLPPGLSSHTDYAALLELNEVILKACETDPRRRYASAKQLHADLGYLSHGKSVRHAHRVDHRRRLLRRGAGWLAGGATALTLIALASRVTQPSGISRERKVKPSTNKQANLYYDLGMRHHDKLRGTNFQMAAEYFKQATNADPRYAPAYAALAMVYSWSTGDGEWNPGWQFYPEAKQVAEQALALDESLATPHAVLGPYYAMWEWNWKEAEKQCRLAIQRDPSASNCRQSYAEVLRMMGRTDEALQQMEEAKNLDPNSFTIQKRLTSYLASARRFPEAISRIPVLMAMDQTANMSGFHSSVLCALGRYREAIEVEWKSRADRGESNEELERDLGELKRTAEAELPQAYWRRGLDVDQRWNRGPYAEACVYAQLGKTNDALTRLETARDSHDMLLTFLVMTDWTLDPVRKEPRFRAILKAMNLVE